MTGTSKEDHVFLKWVSYIYYLLHFWKDIVGVKALIDLGSKVNAMIPMYTSKLGFKVQYISIGAQNINGSILEIFEIILISF